MTWRMETGRGDGKKGRGEHSCSSDDIQEEKERKEGRGRTERELPGPSVIHFEGTTLTGLTSPL